MSTPSDEEGRPSTDGASTDSGSITQAVSTSTQKVVGETSATDAVGVLGRTTAGSSVTYGVVGETDSTDSGATGVRGEATSMASGTTGVHGKSNGGGGLTSEAVFADARGVGASGLVADASGGVGDGVRGEADSDGYYGVYGKHTASAGSSAYGVRAYTNSSDAPALRAVGSGGGAISTDGNVSVDGDHSVTGAQSIGNLGASAYLSTTQTIPDNSGTTVEFDTEVADDSNDFDTSTGVFTCPADGDYHVSTCINWSGNFPSGTIHDVGIRVGVTTVAQQSQSVTNDNASGIISTHLCKTLKGLSSGDTISIEVRHTSGDGEDLSTGQSDTYVTIDKVG